MISRSRKKRTIRPVLARYTVANVSSRFLPASIARPHKVVAGDHDALGITDDEPLPITASPPVVCQKEREQYTMYYASIRRIYAMARRYFYIKTRDLHRIANLMYFPVIDIFVGGLMWLWQERMAHGLALHTQEYLLELMFWIIITSTHIDICLNLLEEFQARNINNIVASPLRGFEWLLSVAMVALVEALCAIFVCAITIWLVFGINVMHLGLLLPAYCFLLAMSGFAIGLLTCSFLIRFGQRLTILMWALPYLCIPLSAPFYPVAALPVWAQYIAFCMPMSYVFESVRHAIHTGSSPVAYLGISLILNCMYIVGILLFFRHMLRSTANKGFMRLEQE